jgi:hypothetical protein
MYIENMSGNIVERGYSVYLNGEVITAQALAQQGISDASTAQTDATQALADASNAQTSADTADGKAVAVDTKADNLNLSRNLDMEALLQELVVDVTVPDGAFILGDDAGYYAWDSGSSEYRVTAYASGEALDESDAIANATQFETISKGNGLYLLLEDDGGTLYIVNHATGTREPIDDVIDGTGNDRASASSDAFESAKNPFHYLVRYTYAPINLSHYQNSNDIYSVHLRANDGNGDPKLWLYKDTGANDKLVSSAMSNVEERRLYVHEIV